MLGPGIGKSTIAASLFTKMKELGYSAELASEYAKELVYEKSYDKMKDQVYLLGKTFHKLYSLKNNVDFVISDSPLLLSMIYFKYNNMQQIIDESTFHKFTYELHKSFGDNQLNILLKRDKNIKFENKARIHNENESNIIQDNIEIMLKDLNEKYYVITNTFGDTEITRNQIMRLMKVNGLL